ncbi:MAG: hypothetical protein L0H81_04760, partial [Actinomyces sp.]|nr:hypothetical protein [Actinomyces sp.]
MTGKDVMPLPPDIRAQAEELARDFETVGAAVAHTQVAATSPGGVPGWLGESADAYTDEIRRLGDHARELSGSFAAPANALRTWSDETGLAVDSRVPELWRRYDEAEARYQAALADLRHRDQDSLLPRAYSWIEGGEEGMIARERAAVQARVKAEYRREMERLDASAQEAAASVRGVLDQVAGAGSADGGRSAVGARLFDDMPLVDGQATWEHAQEVAPDIVRVMLDQDLSPDELQVFRDRYADLLHDPFYVNALQEHVTPQDLAEFSLQVAGTAPMVEDGVGSEVLRAVGTALVLSTGGTNLEGGAGSQTSFETARAGLITQDGSTVEENRGEWMEQFKEAGRTLHDRSDLSPAFTWMEMTGYEVFSQLMGAAAQENPELALGPAFFDDPSGGRSVAADIVAWDNEVKEYRQLHGYRSGPLLFPDGVSTRDPLHSMYLLMDRPDSLDLDTADAALVAADRGRLDAIQRFLTTDTPFDVDTNWDGEVTHGEKRGDVVMPDEKPVDMTRYLTGLRQSGGYGGTYHGFQDGGEAFGEAIQQASETGRYPEPRAEDYARPEDFTQAHRSWESGREAFSDRHDRATQIAGNFLLGYQDGLDADFNVSWVGDTDTVDGQDVFGHSNPALRSWAGVILAPHVGGITDSLSGLYTGTGVAGLGPDGHRFQFDATMANKILGANGVLVDLGFDNPGVDEHGTTDKSDDTYIGGRAPAIDNILTAARQGFEADLRAALTAGDSGVRAADRWAPLIEAAFTAPEEATGEALRALDARNERWQGLVSAGLGAVPFGDIVSDKVGSWAIGQVKDNALTPTLDALLSTDNASATPGQVVERGEMAETYMRDTVYRSLTSHGTFPDGPDSPANYCLGLESDRSFVSSDGRVIPYDRMQPSQRREFETYLLDTLAGTDNAQ